MPLKEFRYLAFDKYGNRLTFVAGISSNPREIINLASAHRFREISPEACIQTMQHKDIEYIYVNYLLKTLRPHELELSAEASLHTALCKDWVRLVKIESASSIQKEATARIYLDLQQALNTLVQQERTTAAIAQEVFQLESTVNKGLIYIGAFMHGVSSSAVDFAKWLKEASDVINPIVISFNAFEAANKANNTEEFIQGFSDIRRRELIEALGFDPSHITRAKFDEAWDVLTLVYNDDKIQRMLARFCIDYVKAQHSVTYFKVGGSAVFEIIFAAVLVAVTGGTALAVTATARAGHKIRQFKTVGTLLAKLADLTPQMRKKKAKIKQQTTPSNIYDYTTASYVPAANLPPIAGSNRVHKRVHPDGKQPSPTDKYGDPYTLQANGKPLGAKAGVMPNEHLGLEKLTPKQNQLINEGYPDLVKNKEFKNFSSLEPKTLKPGDTVYRIIDEKANPAGGYWATELPNNKTEWRSNYAVKDSWNDNGYYVKHTVPEGEEIKVWQGKTAGQKYKEHDGKQFYLEGGNEQIFMEPGTLKAEGLAPQQTHWPEV